MARRTLLSTGAMATLAASTRGALARVPSSALEALRAGLKGRLVLPDDPGYDAVRRVRSFNPETDKRPLAIVRCAAGDDVVRAIAFAQDAKLDLAVRSGGHDVLGASDCEAGVLIDLTPMASVEIDPGTRLARVGAGVLSAPLNLAAGAHGLAPVLGCNPGVGVAGLTLGGGIGWFLGTHGAACDNLVGAEIVTADGARRRISAHEHPDLFWAIRGGGGNFGVVTSLDYRLRAIDTVLGGAVAFRADTPTLIPSFLRFYRDYMQAAPDALAVELNIFPAGAPVMLALACWSGPVDEGERVLAPLRSFAKPMFDSVRVVPYPQLTDSPGGSGSPANLFWRGASLDALSDGAIDGLTQAVRVAPAGWSLGLGHYMHGEITRVHDSATPLIRGNGQMTYFIGAGWNDPARGEPAMRWVRDSMAAMRPWSSARTYVNYLSDDSEAAVRAAYGSNFERLRALKRRFDPTNVFHHNRNIIP